MDKVRVESDDEQVFAQAYLFQMKVNAVIAKAEIDDFIFGRAIWKKMAHSLQPSTCAASKISVRTYWYLSCALLAFAQSFTFNQVSTHTMVYASFGLPLCAKSYLFDQLWSRYLSASGFVWLQLVNNISSISFVQVTPSYTLQQRLSLVINHLWKVFPASSTTSVSDGREQTERHLPCFWKHSGLCNSSDTVEVFQYPAYLLSCSDQSNLELDY